MSELNRTITSYTGAPDSSRKIFRIVSIRSLQLRYPLLPVLRLSNTGCICQRQIDFVFYRDCSNYFDLPPFFIVHFQTVFCVIMVSHFGLISFIVIRSCSGLIQPGSKLRQTRFAGMSVYFRYFEYQQGFQAVLSFYFIFEIAAPIPEISPISIAPTSFP